MQIQRAEAQRKRFPDILICGHIKGTSKLAHSGWGSTEGESGRGSRNEQVILWRLSLSCSLPWSTLIKLSRWQMIWAVVAKFSRFQRMQVTLVETALQKLQKTPVWHHHESLRLSESYPACSPLPGGEQCSGQGVSSSPIIHHSTPHCVDFQLYYTVCSNLGEI